MEIGPPRSVDSDAGDRLLELSASRLEELLADTEALAIARAAVEGLTADDVAALPLAADATLRPPVRPGKILCLGYNYRGPRPRRGGRLRAGSGVPRRLREDAERARRPGRSRSAARRERRRRLRGRDRDRDRAPRARGVARGRDGPRRRLHPLQRRVGTGLAGPVEPVGARQVLRRVRSARARDRHRRRDRRSARPAARGRARRSRDRVAEHVDDGVLHAVPRALPEPGDDARTRRCHLIGNPAEAARCRSPRTGRSPTATPSRCASRASASSPPRSSTRPEDSHDSRHLPPRWKGRARHRDQPRPRTGGGRRARRGRGGCRPARSRGRDRDGRADRGARAAGAFAAPGLRERHAGRARLRGRRGGRHARRPRHPRQQRGHDPPRAGRGVRRVGLGRRARPSISTPSSTCRRPPAAT